MKEKWIKIKVDLWHKETLKESACAVEKMVQTFESLFSIRHLYYARYTTLEASYFEISALTSVNESALRGFFKEKMWKDYVSGVKIEDRGTGSLAHAYVYQAVKNLKPFSDEKNIGPNFAEDADFANLLHWACNMRGLDYLREARYHAFETLRIMHQQAQMSGTIQAFFKRHSKVMKGLVAKDTAEELLKAFDWTNGITHRGKVQGSGEASRRGRQSKRKLSAAAASRRVRG